MRCRPLSHPRPQRCARRWADLRQASRSSPAADAAGCAGGPDGQLVHRPVARPAAGAVVAAPREPEPGGLRQRRATSP
ncbi:MAG: hypothetical protein MZW92_54920 [Comamonadaceae bacterium]|nr:hypothetical protein [Comamonadaceae bacterium]